MADFSDLYTANHLFDEAACRAFLNAHGYHLESAIGQDFSMRRYFRVRKNDHHAILMETLPDHSPHVTRGHKMSDFIRIGKWLRSAGLNTPEIYAADEKAGYMLLESFGDTSFAAHIKAGGEAALLYEAAINALNHLAAQNCPLELPHYEESHVHAGHQKIIEHYLLSKNINHDDALELYIAAWAEIEAAAPTPKSSFIHVDFHAENLMWLPQSAGLNCVGILDFQGGMIGNPAYDIANLLYDARLDIGDDLRRNILDNYDDDMRAHIRILATQFHCRVIGQFIQIAQEKGNQSYLKHIPRLEKYIANALKEPILKPLAQFFKQINLDFTA